MTSEYNSKYVDRVIPRISLRDFGNRIKDITAGIVAAAEEHGVFVLVDHPIPQSAIDTQFAAARSFFDLDDTIKQKTPFAACVNAGWEKNSLVRHSAGCIGCIDGKESYQMHFSNVHMAGCWVDDRDLPGFKMSSLSLMHACHELCRMLMVCLARGLGVDHTVFVKTHDITKPDIKTVLRAMHYISLDPAAPTPPSYCRSGPHADEGAFLTLLFQQPGQSGLEICAGREAVTDFGRGDAWTPIKPAAGEIVCNIGDLLTFRSDSRFKSTLHRVKTPALTSTDRCGDRYSLAFFSQPNGDRIVQGPAQTHPRVTGREFTQLAMEQNFAQLKSEQERRETQETQDREKQSVATSLPSGAFQAATAFSPYAGSMDSGDGAAASAAFAMAASVASAAAMTASIM